jgi:hypothetical protein
MSAASSCEMSAFASGDFSAAAIFISAVKPALPCSISFGTTAAWFSGVPERYSSIRVATASGVSG